MKGTLFTLKLDNLDNYQKVDIYYINKEDMNNIKIGSAIDSFLGGKKITNLNEEGTEQEVCDLKTGECYVIRSKDGLVERINKRYITEDGRQLLSD